MDTQNTLSEVAKIKAKLQAAQLPASLLEKANEQIERIDLALKYGGNLSQLDITEKYIDWICSLPWFKKTEDTLDIQKAKQLLDKNHFGLTAVKARVLEYLSLLIIQKQRVKDAVFHAPALFFVGLAGTGKTTFTKSIAESLGRSFIRIPFGGLSSAYDLRGQSKTTMEAEPGLIIRAMKQAGSRNPVILLDELDRVTPESRASIMGVLIELLDPGQNYNFSDYFIDYPFDLSQVIFVATANNTNNISTAVLDRLEVIQMPSYTDDEKMEIGKTYVLPKYLAAVGLTSENFRIDQSVWPLLVRPLGFEPGIRSLERAIEGMVRKAALRIVSGQGMNFTVTVDNMKEYM